MKALFRLTYLLVIALLAGCYETESPVFEKGEKTAIAGTFHCADRIGGGPNTHTFTEKRDGIWPFASYEYVDDEGDQNLFHRIPSGLFVGQSESKKGNFSYAFIDFTDERTFLVLSADLTNKGDRIEPLLKKFGVESNNRGGSLLLKGDKGKIADFLAAHDKTLLTVVMKCERAIN
jgi:hypothetical protein